MGQRTKPLRNRQTQHLYSEDYVHTEKGLDGRMVLILMYVTNKLTYFLTPTASRWIQGQKDGIGTACKNKNTNVPRLEKRNDPHSFRLVLAS